MLTEALPIYSGGLGNVAGDQLKAASDLGVPVIGVGLLYQQGYFRQLIDKNGFQKALYPYNDPGQLPIAPLRKSNGEWLRLRIQLPGYALWIRAWEVRVGRTKLYLLDSNDIANFPAHRGITSELYGGDSELRLQQELILGIGGWRLLETLGLKPEVCHLNEGHAAFAVLERASSVMKAEGVPFSTALAITRAGNIFTTHTAVPAGFDLFSPSLIEKYLKIYAENQLGISTQDLLGLGRKNPSDPAEYFNMAYLAIRGSGSINGVSELHGKVSRKIFNHLFPNWPIEEIPVGSVTNGVHAPSWDSIGADNLWTEFCGKNRWLGKPEELKKEIQNISNEKIWNMKNESRAELIAFTRKRLMRQLIIRGASEELLEQTKHLFDPNTLTLGFARRFATYKRPNMLLHDPERLLRILNDPERPVQLIIAGKAHPADVPGQNLIHEWMEFIQKPEARPHVIFLSDYDMLLTAHLVQGVDVWINTPRRPWEACGTSGMKVLVNGGLNLSELDGWWAEAYAPEIGWALGDGREHDNDPSWEASEAFNLYEILEKTIIPEFYTRDSSLIPTSWIGKIRESMARLTPRFSATRAVCEYTEKHYLKAAKSYMERSQNQATLGKEIAAWQNTIEEKWSLLHFNETKVETKGEQFVFEVQLFLGDLEPSAVKLELFANELPVPQEMKYIRELGENSKVHVYQAFVPTTVPAASYTPRIVPFHATVSVPLEIDKILWQR